jgi:quercetin dioxygenase-like cupin family protein
MIGNRKFVAIAAATSALAFGAMQIAPALATPGSGFAPSPIVTGQFDPLHTISHKDSRWPTWDLLFKTKADTDLGVDVLTVQPGGYSGWHSHAGPIYVTVKAGSVNWYNGADCSVRTFHVGDTYVEPAHSVHFVENPTDEVTTLVAVAPRPHGAPGRLDADEPECAKAN